MPDTTGGLPMSHAAAAASATLTGLLLDPELAAGDRLMERIAATAADTFPDTLACGIIAPGPRQESGTHVRPAGASNAIAARADHLQCALNEGPGLSSLSTGSVVEVGDTSTDDRWHTFRPAMKSLGVVAMSAIPLRTGDSILGVLGIYRSRRGPYDDVTLRTATIFADHAAVVLAAADRYAALAEQNEHLHQALESRSTIDQAIGVIMATQHCTPAEALEVLRRTSRYRNRKVRDLAGAIVATAGRPPTLS